MENDKQPNTKTCNVSELVVYNKFTVVSDPLKRRKKRSREQLQQEKLNQGIPDKAESLPSAKKSCIKDNKPDESSLAPPKNNEQNGRYNTTFPFTNTIADDLDLNSTYSDEVEIPALLQKITEKNGKNEKRITTLEEKLKEVTEEKEEYKQQTIALKEQVRKLTEQKEEETKAVDKSDDSPFLSFL